MIFCTETVSSSKLPAASRQIIVSLAVCLSRRRPKQMSFRLKNKCWSAHSHSPSHQFPLKPEVKFYPYYDWSESNHNPNSFVPVGKLVICHGRLANSQIKQGVWLVLCEIVYSMSIHSSQCTFHGLIKDILRKRNVRRCELHERTERTVGEYLVRNF